MGDQLIMLISVALLFVIVGEPVECVRVGMLTVDEASNLVLGVRHILDNVLERVLTLVLKSVLNAKALDLCGRQLLALRLTWGSLFRLLSFLLFCFGWLHSNRHLMHDNWRVVHIMHNDRCCHMMDW